MKFSTKEFLQTKLKNILNYKNIHISNCELKMYDYNELLYLIKKYDVKVINSHIRNNSWYIESYAY